MLLVSVVWTGTPWTGVVTALWPLMSLSWANPSAAVAQLPRTPC